MNPLFPSFSSDRIMTFFLRAGVVFAAAVQVAADPSLTVRTETGIFTGLQNTDFTGVREFRNIPFAQPPVGSLRFQPPQRLPPSKQHRYSTRFPPLMPPVFLQRRKLLESLRAISITPSEDCLSLAIWTPYDVPSDAKLPVAFFMTGGGFQTNGVDVPGQIPAPWVNRSQEHIVVTINYRLNIFGFPNARALDSPNLAILDQRLALEWVHENIAAFGGDPESIMMWGQSAGAMSTDIHNYAFWDNPIVHGSFSQSGTALAPIFSSDYSHSSFTTVAKNLGCDFPDNPTAELECMQQVPVDLIENFIGQYDGPASLSFEPIPDDRVVFSDYPARAVAGKISPRPAIFSDAANEFATLYTWPSGNASAGPYQPFVDAGTLGAFVCPNARTSILRDKANVTTYRYQYAGVWPNQNPYSWLGAYHSSDLMMNFGTYFYDRTNSTTGPTALEIRTSEAMQDHILAFMKDPKDGPPAIGWNPYTYGGNVVRFGANGVPVQNASGYAIDGPCYGEGTYDPFP
ncbi:Alpha/Beta hydrolase protein [Penicillium riverlandense]|uniref:Alpha/Beta hydrolase protein n=1 Tax=Penicillium riverlandense TaxID=1903569 RepID=UPI0025482BA6|nr:Alpha/Beta hydrolase protein [Penicillium riverlandense]KAJ5833805.1 Alpha/Beta hydrolase protein [Penicillium riverlandense]